MTHFGNFRPIQVLFYWLIGRTVFEQAEPTLRKAVVWPSSSNPIDQHCSACSGKNLWLLWVEWNKCRWAVSPAQDSLGEPTSSILDILHPGQWRPPLCCCAAELGQSLSGAAAALLPPHAHTDMRAKVNLILREMTWNVPTQPTRKRRVSFSSWPCCFLASVNKMSLSLPGISENIFSFFFLASKIFVEFCSKRGWFYSATFIKESKAFFKSHPLPPPLGLFYNCVFTVCDYWRYSKK